MRVSAHRDQAAEIVAAIREAAGERSRTGRPRKPHRAARLLQRGRALMHARVSFAGWYRSGI
jgi:hypothetical protein